MKQIFLSQILLIFAAVPNVAADESSSTLPDWIWFEKDSHNQSAGLLSQDFHCDGSIRAARLRIAADFASCVIQLNGANVAIVDDFGPLADIDVTRHLRLGDNSLQLQVKGSAGPSAIAAVLTIDSAENRIQAIATDASWHAGTDQAVRLAVSAGTVSPQFWIGEDRSEVTAFDDYTQWKMAGSDEKNDFDTARIATRPGFEVELVRKAASDEGSWISMAFDPEGRITIAREDEGLLRLTLATDDQHQLIETINSDLKECRGLVYAHDSLYANANNSKGLYHLTSTASDGRFDRVELLREFPGGVGHGRNDLALGPDGWIYSIHGDSVQLPESDITDRTSPFRDSGRKQPDGQGHLIRTDKDGKSWELVATGLRNPFGIDFNADGELFTYDADAEFDMGAPWYRSTRIDHLVSGADFGWRALTQQWPPYELDHADNALPSASIGKGSPTAVKFGTASNFPAPWRDDLFILDWAYGRIVACHLFPRGAGYVARSETFLKGRPLNVTDLDFGPDGSMYFVTGGRKTESSLYRLRWTGTADVSPPATAHQLSRRDWSAKQRQLRHALEQLHSKFAVNSVEAIASAWIHLSSPDPSIRHAACVALEHQPVDEWRERALTEQDAQTIPPALLSLARAGVPEDRLQILHALNRISVTELSGLQKLMVLHTYTMVLSHPADFNADLIDATKIRLNSWLQHESVQTAAEFAPIGAGGGARRKLSRVVMTLAPSVAHPAVIQALLTSTTQEDRILYLFLLRDATTGWNDAARLRYFEIQNEVERTALGGDGMPGFLKQIREAAVSRLSEHERQALSHVIIAPENAEAAMTITRPHVRDWQLQDVAEILASGAQSEGIVDRGRTLFAATLCSRCHRVGHIGGVVGPDLTSVGGRFSKRDILTSILAPSDVLAEKYRNETIVTQAGKSVTGRILLSGDYRSPTIRISTDPMDASRVTEISKADIELHVPSDVSPMPKGLLSTLTAEEINNLLTFLVHAAE